MPNIPVNLFIDKQVYAARDGVTGFAGDFKTKNYIFKKNNNIGKIYSYVRDNNTGKYYFMIYVTRDDYENFRPSYFLASAADLDIQGLKVAFQQFEKEQKEKEAQQQINDKGLFRFYIEKYFPVVLLIVGASYVVPKILKRNEK